MENEKTQWEGGGESGRETGGKSHTYGKLKEIAQSLEKIEEKK